MAPRTLSISPYGARTALFGPDLMFSGPGMWNSGPGFWPAGVPARPSTPETLIFGFLDFGFLDVWTFWVLGFGVGAVIVHDHGRRRS